MVFYLFKNMSGTKREREGSDSDSEWVGPLPSEAAPVKKQKGSVVFNLEIFGKLFNKPTIFVTLNLLEGSTSWKKIS